MTMSRKSIESSSIWSRSFRSGFRFDRSSSGATVWMMSLTAVSISSRFMSVGKGEGSAGDAPDDERRVDAEHAEGEVQDRVDAADLARLPDHEIADLAGGVEVVDVDRRVDEAVLE